MSEYSNRLYSSDLTTFKNTGVYSTSISTSGTVLAGASAEFSASISLPEDQVFAYATASYTDITSLRSGYQILPTFDAYIATTPVGFLNWAIYYEINGATVTFKAFVFNPYGTPEAIPATTIPIKYVTYTVDE